MGRTGAAFGGEPRLFLLKHFVNYQQNRAPRIGLKSLTSASVRSCEIPQKPLLANNYGSVSDECAVQPKLGLK